MEYKHLAFIFTALAVGIVTFFKVLRRVNGWYYGIKFCSKKYKIPPGDMGWPYFGNTLHLFIYSLNNGPDSLLSYFTTRFGPGGMYRGHIFGKPSIIVTKPEVTRKILMDEENIDRGLAEYMKRIIKLSTTVEEDKLIRRLLAPVKSQGLLSYYFDYFDRTVRTTFEKYVATEEPIEFLHNMYKLTYSAFIKVLFGGEIDKKLFDEFYEGFTSVILALHDLPINLPGFDYYKGIKAKDRLVKALEGILDERRKAKDYKSRSPNIIDMLLSHIDEDDYEGKSISDKKIIEVLLLYGFAGFEPVALNAIKAIMNLEKHPQFLEKAKKEQEDIVKRRPSSNVGLSFDEVKQMKYINHVITESLRISTDQTIFIKDTKKTYDIDGYTIPKGWKFFATICNIHMDPDIYVNPEEFNPSRWEDMQIKPGHFLTFSMGPRACVGSNFARLQISIILHYYLLYYRFEQVNPEKKTAPRENFIVRFKKRFKQVDPEVKTYPRENFVGRFKKRSVSTDCN